MISMAQKFLGIYLLLLMMLSAFTLFAQSERPAHYQIFGGYSYLSNSFNGVPGARQSLNGWDASVGFPAWRNLRFKIDAFGYRGTNTGASQNAFFILGGGQYDWHLHRETIFAEGMIGDGGLPRYWGPNQLPGETASFAAVAGGGFDTRLARHFALRANGDFVYSNFALVQSVATLVPTRVPGLPNYFGRISTGVVLLF